MGAGRTLQLPARQAKATTLALLPALAVALALGAASLTGLLDGSATLPAAPRAQHAAARPGLLSLPLRAQGPISASLGADSASYRVSSSKGKMRASSPAERLSSRFTSAGVTVTAGPARVGLGLRAVGDGTSLSRLAPVSPRAANNRVTYAHGGGLSEWYVNGPLGLEQGFTVASAPATGHLSLALTLSGNTSPRLAHDAQSVAFLRNGKSALRYSGLSVIDASGRRLPSSLALSGRELTIHVRSAGARFPVTVDPFVQDGAKLSPTGASGSGSFGWSVALSADGSTALVGAPADNDRKGAAWAFVRSGSTWTQQGAKLTPLPGDREEGQGIFGESRFGEFGSSVALSADGNTALIGAEGDLEEEGAAWFFVRSGSTWSQQGGPEIPFLGSGGNEGVPYESAESRFGSAVSLSADGNVALVGAPDANDGEGIGFLYTRSGSKWSELANLEANDESGAAGSELGTSVALSADGTTALLGGPADGLTAGQDPGAAWVFSKSSGPWAQQGPKLTGSEESGTKSAFGDAVALSADGNTAVIGAPQDSSRAGAAFAFVRSGTTWSQQGPKLLAEGESGAGGFGSSVALSSDGDTALLGSPEESSSTGSAWVFSRSGTTWAQVEELTGAGVEPGAQFGRVVALSGDASTALIGDRAGGARVFVTASLPSVVTEAAAPVGQTSATLNGEVDPNGEAISECEFEYGTTSSYGSTAPCSSPPGEGSSPVAVSAPVAGLTAGTSYHFRLLATSAAGTNVGEDRTFFSQPEAPTVTTGTASSVTTSSATLSGTVNPNHGAVSECEFEYGTSSSYGSTVPCTPSPGSGSSPVTVSGSISGLSANVTYYYRLRATNAGGTGFGAGQSFTALNGAPEFGFCVKVAPGAGAYANSGCTKTGGKGIYSWQTSGLAGTTFTVRHLSGLINLTVKGKALVLQCSDVSGTGEFSGPKTIGATTLTLHNCFDGNRSCASPGQAAGTVVSHQLEGVLGVEKLGATALKDKLGLDLFPSGHSGPVAEFSCIAEGPLTTIRGSVITPLKSNKMQFEQKLNFKAPKGIQKPESFVGGSRDVLEEQIGSGSPTTLGFSMKAGLTSAHEVEANSVV
jgi:FG-GAP repeat